MLCRDCGIELNSYGVCPQCMRYMLPEQHVPYNNQHQRQEYHPQNIVPGGYVQNYSNGTINNNGMMYNRMINPNVPIDRCLSCGNPVMRIAANCPMCNNLTPYGKAINAYEEKKRKARTGNFVTDVILLIILIIVESKLANESAWMETLGLIQEADDIKKTAKYVLLGVIVMSLIVHIINKIAVSIKKNNVINYNPNYFRKK